MEKELTGRHVLLITVSAFAVIIGANAILAWQAIATFPGLEVKNSYVASQSFEAERHAQQALGWAAATRFAAGVLRVEFTGAEGAPAKVASVEGLFGRATVASEDQPLAFAETAPGVFEAEAQAGRGQWVLHLKAFTQDGTVFRQRVAVPVFE
jgi:nitrogen fixation protein FixH